MHQPWLRGWLAWTVGILATMLLIVTLGSLTGCGGFHPFANIHSPSGGSPVVQGTFSDDIHGFFTPIIWILVIVAAGTAVASAWVPFLSFRVSLLAFAAALGLLWLRHILEAHPWLIPLSVGGVALWVAFPYLHLTVLSMLGTKDNSTFLDHLKSLFPWTKHAVPTLANPEPLEPVSNAYTFPA